MKKTLLILVIISSYLSYSQSAVDIKFGNFNKEKHANVFLLDGLYHQKNYYTIKGVYSKRKAYASYFRIEKYDSDFNLIEDYILNNNDHNFYRKAIISDDNLHLLMIHNEKKAIYIADYKTKIDQLNFSKDILYELKNAKLKSDGSSILSLMVANYSPKKDYDDLGKIITSENNNFFSISFDLHKANTEFHLVIGFNNKFEKIYENRLTKDVKDKSFLVRNIVVSNNDGTTFYICKQYHENSTKEFFKKNKKNKTIKVNYHYEIYKINSKEQFIKIENKNLLYQPLSISRNGKLYITGLSFDTSKKKPPRAGFQVPYSDLTFLSKKIAEFRSGFYKMEIDEKSFENADITYTPFSETIYNATKKLYGNKPKKASIIGDREYLLRKIFLTKNNDFIYYFERVILMERYINGRTATTHFFNNVASVRINDKGEIITVNAVIKNQKGGHKNYRAASCAFTHVDNKDYFFFNAKNIKEQQEKTIFNGKEALYKIDFTNSKLQYDNVMDEKENKTIFYIKNHIILNDDNGSIISSVKRKENSGLALIKVH